MGQHLEEGPHLNLLVLRQWLQQVLSQQHHFRVKASDDAPAGAMGVHAHPPPPPAITVNAGDVTAAAARDSGEALKWSQS